MTQPIALLEGKRGLVVGIANERSILENIKAFINQLGAVGN